MEIATKSDFTLESLADANVDLSHFFSDATDDEPSYGVQEANALYIKTGAHVHPGIFRCDVCGARYRHGAIFTHENGLTFTTGETCAAKISAGLTGQQWRDHRAHVRKLGRSAIERMERRRVVREFLQGVELEARRALGAARQHYIVADLRTRLIRWGSLSKKQLALAVSIAADLHAKSEEPAGVTEPIFANNERVPIKATILAVTFRDNDYGGTYKLLLAVDTDKGRQKLWGTCPQAFFDQVYDEHRAAVEAAETQEELDAVRDADKGAMKALKGRTVTFVAKVQHGSDADFCFYSRPTKPTLHPA